MIHVFFSFLHNHLNFPLSVPLWLFAVCLMGCYGYGLWTGYFSKRE